MRSRLKLGKHKTVILNSPEVLRRSKIRRRTAVIIVVGVIVAAAITGIHVATALTKQCTTTPTKMFDEESVPKYIIGPDYKPIPVNPTTTVVMLTSCR